MVTDNMFLRVQAPKERIRGHADVTPVRTSRTLNEQVGAEIYFKCKNLQRVGAFKFRGAFNCISQLSEEEKGARCHHVFVGKPCASGRIGRAAAERPNHDRHAHECVGYQASCNRGLWRDGR